MAYTTIKKPSDYFNTKLYTGNGSTQNITGVGFQPDWVWTKCRSTINSHRVIDAVRGVTKAIVTNSAGTEFTETNGLSAFGADGYTLNGNLASMNTNGDTYASWNWLANGAGSANTDGSITSTVSANTTSGFSIVSYTGNGSGSATVGHGLGVIPSMIIIKARTAGSANGYWYVKHKSLSSNYNINLNVTDAASNVTSFSQGGIGDLDNVNTFDFASGTSGITTVNASGTDFIAYCFADVQGYSKFGSFVGSSSQQFVYLGFKPRWFLWKNTSQGDSTYDHWGMVDTLRQTPNGATDGYMRANQNLVESSFSGNGLFFLSNGIQFNNTGRYNNNSGDTYIYMAFAEQPLVGDNPATAR